jgi:hypothetical protein
MCPALSNCERDWRQGQLRMSGKSRWRTRGAQQRRKALVLGFFFNKKKLSLNQQSGRKNRGAVSWRKEGRQGGGWIDSGIVSDDEVSTDEGGDGNDRDQIENRKYPRLEFQPRLSSPPSGAPQS